MNYKSLFKVFPSYELLTKINYAKEHHMMANSDSKIFLTRWSIDNNNYILYNKYSWIK